MHRTNSLTTFLLAGVLILQTQTGCKKGWLDVNYNPKDLTDNSATPDLLLAGQLQNCIATRDDRFCQQWMGYWCHFQGPMGIEIQTYNHISAHPGSALFSGTIPPDLAYLEQKSRQLGATYYEGIARVIKALKWHRAVDVLNNMPYTDAFNPKLLQPRYDEGKFIYEDLIKQLDTAITLIKNADALKNSKINLTDIMFHGDVSKWLKFINTLKLRLLIHQANRPDRASYIATEIEKIKTSGNGFLGTGENASVNPGYNLPKQFLSYYFGYFSNNNPYGGGDYDALTGVQSIHVAHANIVALNFLKADHDPRMGLFYSPIQNPLPPGAPEPFPQPDPQDFRGSQFGKFVDNITYPYQESYNLSAVGGSANNTPVTSAAKGIIKGYDMADWVMTSVESLFLQAEAIQRGWLPGDAEQAYLAAVKESFRWLNAGGNSDMPSLSDDIFNAWYASEAANPQVNWAAAPDKYKLLMYQKYMAFNGIEPMETWTDYRRNGRYPAIPASVDPARVGNTIPYRMEYDENEYIVNADHVNAQGKINVFTDKIWWMP